MFKKKYLFYILFTLLFLVLIFLGFLSVKSFSQIITRKNAMKNALSVDLTAPYFDIFSTN